MKRVIRAGNHSLAPLVHVVRSSRGQQWEALVCASAFRHRPMAGGGAGGAWSGKVFKPNLAPPGGVAGVPGVPRTVAGSSLACQ